MKLREVFDVFSRRNTQAKALQTEVSITLRNKILMLCQDMFSNSRLGYFVEDYGKEFWDEISRFLQYRHGKFRLVEEHASLSNMEDLLTFLLNCKGEEFLDFVEYIFKVRCLFHLRVEENVLVNEINEIFISENAAYALTAMVKEEVLEKSTDFPFAGREVNKIKIASYPKVISKDDYVAHANLINPVLNLLMDSKYSAANKEYLAALEDYRKKDYGDCLTKCCSSFESVMKIICSEKQWPYKQTDTAATLLKIIIDKTGLDSFFEQPFIIIATLRNRLSSSHGAGTQMKAVSQNKAKYSLNATAAAILFLTEEVK